MRIPATLDIFEDCSDAVIAQTLDGVVTAWNCGAVVLFGYTAKEAIGRSLPAPSADRAQALADISARVGAGERVPHIESALIAKDGRRLEVSVAVSPIRDRTGGGIIGISLIVRDMSLRMSSLVHQSLLLHKAQQVARLGFIEVEFPQGPDQPWRRLWSEETFRLLGVDPATPPSRELFMSAVLEEDRPIVEAIYAEIAKGAKPSDFIFRVRTGDGDLRFLECIAAQEVDAAGRPWRLFTTLQDITERRHAELRLRTQLGRLDLLRRITRAIGERQDLPSIFQVVVRQLEEDLPIEFGCICRYDPSAKTLRVASIGSASEQRAADLGLPVRTEISVAAGFEPYVAGSLVYEGDAAAVDRPVPRRFADHGLRSLVAVPLAVDSQIFGALVVARRAQGSFNAAECEFLRQLGDQVGLAAHQMQLHDALQGAYDDLRRTQQAVMQQERLRSLGQMASGIAHDINNAISPVMLYAESMLEREQALSARSRGYLECIKRAIEDVGHTVSRMREFYRQREPQLQLSPVDANEMAEQVVDLTRARWHDMSLQRGVEITAAVDLAADLPPIQGVPSEIREALINLVFNAVDAMPDGGTVTVRTRLEPPSGGKPSRVRIEVADTGVGMDEETRKRCLEPFFTTKGDRGTGLGLAMVYGIVQRHGAAIDIDSSPGKGTTVSMRFVVATTAAAGKDPGPVRIPTRLRLLVVDDDPILLRSLHDILETDGHAVTTMGGGQAGLDVFRAAPRDFDAVITDLGMPRVDGRAVAQGVKDSSPGMPVIMLTGWGQRLVAEGEVPAGVDRVLNKPPNLGELRAALAHCCPDDGAQRP